MAKHETIADIIAEIRALSNPISDGIIAINGSIIADRLEAALKRDTKELRVEIERLKEERNYSGVRERQRLRAKGFAIVPKEQLERGDCAKLREALIEILEYIESFHKYITPGKGKKLTTLFAVADTIRNKARAALAAPPRNCDRFATKFDAKHEWEKVCKAGLPEQGPFEDWIFYPATEKEGANNGNE